MHSQMSAFIPFPLPPTPAIPDAVCHDIRDHGAVSGGDVLNTAAIAAAIDACAARGGGRVLVPAGVWLTGPVHLRSRIELHLEKGAELRFSRDPAHYLPVVFQQRGGIRCHNYSPLIYARGCHDVALTGAGVLEGQGDAWWPWKLAQPGMVDLFRANTLRTPVPERVYGTPAHGVRPPFFQAIECRDVLVEGVTFRNSPSWTIHPVWCENVTVRGVTVTNPPHAHNTDGIDPDGCRNVLVEHCLVDTGDDGICLKSGREPDAWEAGKPCENVVVRHCRVFSAHGGFVIGSETAGGIANVLVHDCDFDGTDIGVRVKTQAGRGAFIKNIQVERVRMSRIAKEAILVTLRYDGEPLDRASAAATDARVPDVRDMLFRDIESAGSRIGLRLEGLPGHPLRSLRFEHLRLVAETDVVSEDVADLTTRDVVITRPEAAVPAGGSSRS